MRFEGRVIKHGTNWLVEIPAFDAMTQARTKEEAYEMAQDLIEMMASSRGFRVTVYPREKETFEIGANHTGVLVALLLRRQRERHGVSLAQASRRLGQRSRNAYARYERGQAIPTVEKLDRLLEAIAPHQAIVWRFVT